MRRTAFLAVALISFVPHSAASAIDLRTATESTSATAVEDTPVDDGPADDVTADSRVSMATYHGRTIDLRDGWDGAMACVVAQSGTSCFDSEAEMDAFIDDTTPTGTSGFRAARSVCGSSLRLYDFTSFGVPVVAFTQRFVYVNLSAVGFDNRTSSYKVGACSVIMWDGASGTGAVYTGPSWAWVQSATMVPFWDNRISSIYIN